MKRIVTILLSLVFILSIVFPLVFPSPVSARSSCNNVGISVSKPPDIYTDTKPSVTITLSGSLETGSTYTVTLSATRYADVSHSSTVSGTETSFIFTEDIATKRKPADTGVRHIIVATDSFECDGGSYRVLEQASCDISVISNNPASSSCVDNESTIEITIKNALWQGEILSGKHGLRDQVNGQQLGFVNLDANGNGSVSVGPFDIGHKISQVRLFSGDLFTTNFVCEKQLDITVIDSCSAAVEPGSGGTLEPYDPGCTRGDTDNVKTALGCLPTDPETFVNKALPWAIGIGAGIAFLLGILGAAMISLSAGNPEKMQAGKEMITSAIAGLLLIIFAVLILKVVGVDILKLFFWEDPYAQF